MSSPPVHHPQMLPTNLTIGKTVYQPSEDNKRKQKQGILVDSHSDHNSGPESGDENENKEDNFPLFI
ncbi:hypothetical protein CROQUDRAFT_99096 [Cronartium quercuum f. sp. fusiforme G11]|uniref:Uncharacterized protein n=1 Tax=Cronartium quercuum f. sp. fusiforme G11 TaxID=708437 RepID=A0A9P6N797_9BASI|nr:hypothetical protein CROQUDRAFT_99096 [Cronartium quercuum f. sp. fusiforme G11]